MLFTNFFCNYFSNVWVNFFLRKFSFNLESKNFWNYKWFEARKRLEKTITMMQIGGFGPLNNKKVFFWILGNPCSLYGHSSRIGNISAFSASNFVPYTGGGLYTVNSDGFFNRKRLLTQYSNEVNHFTSPRRWGIVGFKLNVVLNWLNSISKKASQICILHWIKPR